MTPGTPSADQPPDLGHQRVDRVLGHAGQRRPSAGAVEAVGHEEGATRSSTPSRVSATRRRSAGVRRRRRRRRTGKPGVGRGPGTVPQPTAAARRSRLGGAAAGAATGPERGGHRRHQAVEGVLGRLDGHRRARRPAPTPRGDRPDGGDDRGHARDPQQVDRALDGRRRGEGHRVGRRAPSTAAGSTDAGHRPVGDHLVHPPALGAQPGHDHVAHPFGPDERARTLLGPPAGSRAGGGGLREDRHQCVRDRDRRAPGRGRCPVS